jgi:hypothetical protein
VLKVKKFSKHLFSEERFTADPMTGGLQKPIHWSLPATLTAES